MSMLGEISHLQTLTDDLHTLTLDPHKLPASSEQVGPASYCIVLLYMSSNQSGPLSNLVPPTLSWSGDCGPEGL